MKRIVPADYIFRQDGPNRTSALPDKADKINAVVRGLDLKQSVYEFFLTYMDGAYQTMLEHGDVQLLLKSVRAAECLARRWAIRAQFAFVRLGCI